MVVVHKVKGYEEFQKKVESLKEENTDGLINIYFTGSYNEKGSSWCPDCNRAEPLVMETLLKSAPKDSSFLFVDVGDRTFWKDLYNPFRKDSFLKLSVIPTLVRWQDTPRLEGSQCENTDLLEMFFTEEN